VRLLQQLDRATALQMAGRIRELAKKPAIVGRSGTPDMDRLSAIILEQAQAVPRIILKDLVHTACLLPMPYQELASRRTAAHFASLFCAGCRDVVEHSSFCSCFPASSSLSSGL
jgi:hypothetical protein